MLGQSPQPDVLLRLTEEFGGQSIDTGYLLAGAPELVVDICETSFEIEFGPKLELYRRAGVRENITIQTLPPPHIVWRVLVDGSYREILPDSKGILRSQCFPGLWLDTEAFWADDGKRMQKTLNAGLQSLAHREFAEHLKRQSK
jgi:Putative restriction endonuclease